MEDHVCHHRQGMEDQVCHQTGSVGSGLSLQTVAHKHWDDDDTRVPRERKAVYGPLPDDSTDTERIQSFVWISQKKTGSPAWQFQICFTSPSVRPTHIAGSLYLNNILHVTLAAFLFCVGG